MNLTAITPFASTETTPAVDGFAGLNQPAVKTTPDASLTTQSRVNVGAIPDELRTRPQWVLWKSERRGGGKPTKVPYQLNGRKASAKNPDHWTTFEEIKRASFEGYSGVGFVFTADDPYVGIDIDNCRDGATGGIEGWAKEIIDDLNSYTEVSPSQTGVKVWCKGELPGDGSGKRNKYETGAVEMYQHSRYFTVTGQSIGESVVKDSREAIDRVWRKAIGGTVHKESSNGVALKDHPPTWLSQQQHDAAMEQVLKLPESVEGARGSDVMIHAICEMIRMGLCGDELVAAAELYNLKRCHPPWESHELRRKINDACKMESPLVNEFGDVSRRRSFNLTDMGNGERFADQFGHMVKYVCTWKLWLVWDGRRWARDTTQEIQRLAHETARSIYGEAEKEDRAGDRKAIADWAKRSESRSSLLAMVTLAQSQPSIAISHEVLDQKHLLVNCNNGTFDLEADKLLPHNPDDLITQVTGVDYANEPLPDSSRWRKFCGEVFGNDLELEGYVQRLMGISLVGQQLEHVLPIFHGAGANGKSVFATTIQKALGDYACTAARGLLVKSGGNEHPTLLADLFGNRLVFASETDDGQQLNEGLVKSMTGGDRIKARRMKEDYWEFEPSHTIVLVTNHKPVVRGDNNGIWRRLRLVPFEVTFAEEQQDKELPRKLLEELSGILRWMVRGYRLYQLPGAEGRLQTPAKVAEATTGYRGESDSFLTFYNEACEPVDGSEWGVTDAFDTYCEWCKDEGEQAVQRGQFSKRMNERHEKKRRSSGMCFIGVQATSQEQSSDRQRLSQVKADFEKVGSNDVVM